MQSLYKAIGGQVMSEDQMFVIIISTDIKTKTESKIGIRSMQNQMSCGCTM